MRLTLILLLVFLTGCTTYYKHPHKTNQQFHADWGRCQAQAGQAYGYGGSNQGLAQILARQNVVDSCMAGNGWIEQ